jgi:Domain of unknown function (DUF4190)
MKQCLRCQKTYTDQTLNFCLEDGEMLVMVDGPSRSDDAPPTVMFDAARRTNPTGWPSQQPAAPPAQWQPQPMNAAAPQFGGFPMTMSPNQTLAIVSLCLGIGSITIGWCCYIGVLLSPAAMITGFIAMSQNKKEPTKYGGRGMAIGGIVTGAVYIAIMVLIVILYGAAIFLGSIGGN